MALVRVKAPVIHCWVCSQNIYLCPVRDRIMIKIGLIYIEPHFKCVSEIMAISIKIIYRIVPLPAASTIIICKADFLLWHILTGSR